MSNKDFAELMTLIVGGGSLGVAFGYFQVPFIGVLIASLLFYIVVSVAFRSWKE